MAEKDATARLRRAVKENNLFLVKRLIQRTDIRNPDPGPRRYTSLAWAAILGHEETFEYLLAAGHDDEELSKDAENNTILTLLAELRPAAVGHTASHPDLLGAALRMARLYYERYPFILEWSNLQGKTALHVASLKGNEELVRMFCDLGADIDLPDNLGNTPLHYASAWGHIPVVQLLIERGCQFAARNNEGFTASDFAYSFNTMTTLQETARMQFEANKKARRHVFQQAAARGHEWGGSGPSTHTSTPFFSRASHESARLRSGSGGSRLTLTSDSGEDSGFLGSSAPPYYGQSPLPSTSSQPLSSAISSAWSSSRMPPPFNSGHSSSSSTTTTFSIHSPLPSNQTLPSQSSQNSLGSATVNPASALAPIVTRMRERDADAMAEYKRHRSGSAGTSSDTRSQNGLGTSDAPPPNGSSSHLVGSWIGIPQLTNRRLRPSMSAAQLRSSPPPPSVPTPSLDQQIPRNRSGTNPTSMRPNPPIASTPSDSNGIYSNIPMNNGRAGDLRPGTRRVETLQRRPSDAGDYTGPPSDYAIFPPPPDDVEKSNGPPSSSKVTTPTARRAAFALLSKPSPSIESHGSPSGRLHRRGISISELRG